MKVSDLISLLQQHVQDATVMLWDESTNGELAVAGLGMGEVRSLQLGVRESVGSSALELWNADDGRLEGPFNGVVLGSRFLNADRHALSSVLTPMTEDEAEALSALDWLERDIALPQSVQSYFWSKLEKAADATLGKALSASLRGSADVGLYREAFAAHLASRYRDRRSS